METEMSAKLSREQWEAKLSSLTFRNQAYINGRYVDAASGAIFDRISPRDGKILTAVASCDVEDINRAVKAARDCFEAGTWADLPPKQRKRVLLKLAQLVADHADELALLETVDMGKPISASRYGDIPGVIEAITWNAEAIDKMYDEIAPTGPDALGLVTREPVGVVGAVVPWNFPLIMAAWKAIPAIAMGNSVVLKPAEQSPLSALRFAELATEAGLPDGVLNVVPGFGETAGQALGMHIDVDMVAFTGSTEVGKYFLKYSALSNMKQVSLECGGKSPNIIFADAHDLDAAAQSAANGIFFNSGQVCVAASRLLVEEKIHDEFVEKVRAIGDKLIPGDPLDPATRMGSVVDETQFDRIMGYIGIGHQEGATLVRGGKRACEETGGFYIEPTIFSGVRNAMTIAQEEIFGPVLSVMKFNEADEAIRIANDSIYGLQAYLWTRDVRRVHKISRRLRAGTVMVNTTSGTDMSMPFGGYKQSGMGRDKSLHGLEKYTQLKTTFISLR